MIVAMVKGTSVFVFILIEVITLAIESPKLHEHLVRIHEFGKCKYPIAKVLNVWKELPKELRKENTRFHPRCTILHRCSDDSGCCEGSFDRCVAETMEDVQLEFYIIEMTSTSTKRGTTTLTLKNHTKCVCERRNSNDDLPR